MTPLTHISGYAHVAERYGFEEAVFLDAIVFWYRTNKAENRNFRDGRWWTYNSIKAFEEVFPWWSTKQLRRIANSCRDQGALIAGEYNEDRRDRSLWYTPGDELLALYRLAELGNCTCPNGQMHEPEQAHEGAQMGKCNIRKPCSNHVETNMDTPYSPPAGDAPAETTKPKKSEPKYKPQTFDYFWQRYPKKKSRQAAIRAWDKLKPDLELCRIMNAALKRAVNSLEWAEQDGQYIPHFSTWLNQRRWEDEGVDLSLLPQSKPSGGGWADDEEVL